MNFDVPQPVANVLVSLSRLFPGHHRESSGFVQTGRCSIGEAPQELGLSIVDPGFALVSSSFLLLLVRHLLLLAMHLLLDPGFPSLIADLGRSRTYLSGTPFVPGARSSFMSQACYFL